QAGQQITLSEAMVLVAMIKQPEANPDDPEGEPGYDPTRGPKALQNSKDRWTYIRNNLVSMGKLSAADAQNLAYPNTDKRTQDVAEAAADITRSTAPSAVRNQPANWQAGLVAVEPGTGRVMAYY